MPARVGKQHETCRAAAIRKAPTTRPGFEFLRAQLHSLATRNATSLNGFRHSSRVILLSCVVARKTCTIRGASMQDVLCLRHSKSRFDMLLIDVTLDQGPHTPGYGCLSSPMIKNSP